MGHSISGTTINLTRGDSLEALITISNQDGTTYIPRSGDKIRFAMKKTYDDEQPILVKNISIETMLLVINPEDTAGLDFGKYVYDIQLTTSTNKVDTFISKAVIKLTEEVC